MVRITILSGARAGERCRITQFPCLLGRSVEAQICLEESGVWNKHLELGLDASRSFWLRSFTGALVTINGHSVAQAGLRNGDLIELGAVRLQFWLDETEQRALWLRETLTWAAIAVISFTQLALIYWLLT
jgi:hypothetical protein